MVLHNLTRVLVRLSEGDPDVVILHQGDPDPGHEDGGLRGGDTRTQLTQHAALDQRNTVRLAFCCNNVNKLQSLPAMFIIRVFPAKFVKVERGSLCKQLILPENIIDCVDTLTFQHVRISIHHRFKCFHNL